MPQPDKRAEAVAGLRVRLGHDFTDGQLLERALTHPSVSDGNRKVAHYQVYEFLGDRVLGLLAAEALVGMEPNWREGELTRRHAALTSGPSCARVARSLDVGDALRMSGSTSKLGMRDNDRVLGDAMEAILAAIYLDGGLDAARRVFASAWKDLLEEAPGAPLLDPKTRLNEWAGAHGHRHPIYSVTLRGGTNQAPTFTVEARVGDLAPTIGSGSTVRAAEQAAADVMLARETAT